MKTNHLDIALRDRRILSLHTSALLNGFKNQLGFDIIIWEREKKDRLPEVRLQIDVDPLAKVNNQYMVEILIYGEWKGTVPLSQVSIPDLLLKKWESNDIKRSWKPREN